MELRSSKVKSDWNKSLLVWLKERVNKKNFDATCQLEDVLNRAKELQDSYLLCNPEAEKAELDALWLYNWTYENEIILKATEKLPQVVKLEDVILCYTVSCINLKNSTKLADQTSNENGLLSAKRLKRSSRPIAEISTNTSENIVERRFSSSVEISKVSGKKESAKTGRCEPAVISKKLTVKKHSGRKPISMYLDQELWHWYARCKAKGTKVSMNVVRARARFIYNNAGYKSFKASEGWYRKWLRRWKCCQNAVVGANAHVSKKQFAERLPVNLQSDNHVQKHLEEMIQRADQSATTQDKERPPAIDLQSNSQVHKDLENMNQCAEASPSVQESHLKIINTLQQPRKEEIPVETSSTGLDFMDVDFSLNSRLSDQVNTCLTSNFVSCLDGAEISGLTLPSVGEDSRDLTSVVIMHSLNLTSDTLDLPAFMASVDREHRSLRHSLPSDARIAPKKKGGRYQDAFKLQVVNYAASKNSFKAAAAEYGVHHATVSQWCRDKQMSENISSKALAENCRRIDAPDKCFINWIRECRMTNVEVDDNIVRNKAMQLIENYSVEELDKSCRWFALWVKRWTDVAYEEGMEDELTHVGSKAKDSQIHYPTAFKVEVSIYAELRTNSWAARVFNVSRKRVADWTASKDKLRLKAGRKIASGDAEKQIREWYLGRTAVGRRPNGNEMREKASQVYAALGMSNIKCSSGWLKCFCNRLGVKLRNVSDDDLIEWVLEQFEQNLTVTHTDLQIHGLSVLTMENPNFKASAGWSIRFCRRHPKLFREVATVDTTLPAQLEERVTGFRLWIRNVLQQNGLMLAAIGCMDEVPLTFSSPDEQSKRQLLMRRTGLENAAAVVCLTILADGGVLPPLILLKGPHQDLPQEGILQDKQHLFFMDDLKVTDKVLKKWMDEIWLRHVPSPALLVFDGFEPHLDLRSRVASASGRHDVAIIPSGCSSKLQPLDVHLRTAFLNCVNDAYVRWSHQAIGKAVISPSAADILNFVQAGHRLVCQQQEIVRRSFVVTGITTASDGSQDHLVDDAAWAVAEM